MTQEALKLALEALEKFSHTRIVYKGEDELGVWGCCDVLSSKEHDESCKAIKAITAIKEALAKEKALQALHSENERLGLYKDAYAEQEPVAWPCLIADADFLQDTVTLTMQCQDYKVSAGKHWLSSTPPQRKPLTDEAIDKLNCVYALWDDGESCTIMGIKDFARAIEAAHDIKEKNT